MGQRPPIWDCSAGLPLAGGLRACGNPDQPPRSPALGKKDGLYTYSAPDVSPADPCNKMVGWRFSLHCRRRKDAVAARRFLVEAALGPKPPFCEGACNAGVQIEERRLSIAAGTR